MKLSDSPYAVGTPEHGEWVQRVFIPSVRDERFETDAAIAGAQSIGRKRVDGARDLARLFVPPPSYTIDIDLSGGRDALQEMCAALKTMLDGVDINLVRWLLARVPGPAGSVIASQRRRRHRGR